MSDRTHEETLELLEFALSKGAVHIKVGDVELVLLPPSHVEELPEDPLIEEGSLKQWMTTPMPLRGPDGKPVRIK